MEGVHLFRKETRPLSDRFVLSKAKVHISGFVAGLGAQKVEGNGFLNHQSISWEFQSCSCGRKKGSFWKADQ